MIRQKRQTGAAIIEQNAFQKQPTNHRLFRTRARGAAIESRAEGQLWLRMGFGGFLTLVIMAGALPVVEAASGVSIPPSTGHASRAIAGALIVVAALLDWRKRSKNGWTYNLLLYVYLAAALLLVVNGIARGNRIPDVAVDAWPISVVLASMCLVSVPGRWERLGTPFAIATAVGFGIVIAGQQYLRPGWVETMTEPAGVARTIGYRANALLGLWPLVCVVWWSSSSRIKRAGATGLAVLALGMNLLWAKRAPLVRSLVCAMLGLMVALRRRRLRLRSVIAIVALGAGGLWLVVSTGPGELGLRHLLRKLASPDVSRQVEFGYLWDDLSRAELVFGRGLGGRFDIPDSRFMLREDVEADQLGRSEVHIGIGTLLLKGGVFWLGLHVLIVLFVVIRASGSSPKQTKLTEAAIVLLPYAVFRSIEGLWSLANPFDALLWGTCLGAVTEQVQDSARRSRREGPVWLRSGARRAPMLEEEGPAAVIPEES